MVLNMNDDDHKENNNDYLKPKIITLKSNNDSKIELTDFSEHDLDFPISLDSFKANQKVIWYVSKCVVKRCNVFWGYTKKTLLAPILVINFLLHLE